MNLSTAAVDVALAMAKDTGSPYTLSESTLHLGPRSRHPLTLTALAVPQYPDAAEDALFDELAVSSVFPAASFPVKQRAWGHRLSLPVDSVDFGSISGTTVATRTFVVHDDGYVPVKGSFAQFANLVSVLPVLVPPFGAGVAPLASNEVEVTVEFVPAPAGVYAQDPVLGRPGAVHCAPPPTVHIVGRRL